MSTSRKRYSREFKLEVIRRVQETGRSQAQVAKELGPSTREHAVSEHKHSHGFWFVQVWYSYNQTNVTLLSHASHDFQDARACPGQ